MNPKDRTECPKLSFKVSIGNLYELKKGGNMMSVKIMSSVPLCENRVFWSGDGTC